MAKRLSVIVVVLAGAVAAFVLISSAGSTARRSASARHGLIRHDAERVNGKAGGEPDAEGPGSAAQAAVAERAYPRNYVDDRLALAEYHAFGRLPHRISRSDFRSSRAFALARAGTASNWTSLGPSTPNVSGQASQFFNPATGTGPATQESGRVTALAIDPACTTGNCRMWVGAAGGGVWYTPNALAATVAWTAPATDLPTNAIGSLYFDSSSGTLYAGTGEPNGSGDSEAGLGLFASTDNGVTWTLVTGSSAVATNRSIGAIAIDDTTSPATIYIGTDVARHGSSSVNGGRKTPPGAPALGVYKSTDGGSTFSLETELGTETPPNPAPPSGGSDWFQGGINKLELDPNNHNMLYAGVVGYGIWRANESTSAPRTWTQVFHTMNQNDFSDPSNPIGDTFGDRTEFDLVSHSTTTAIYVGDASDDFVTGGGGPLPEAWRNDKIASETGNTSGAYTNPPGDGWIQLSNSAEPNTGFGVYGFCQNGQCGYDQFVASPPGQPDTVWYGGSMNYSELPAYDQNGFGSPPLSNGRAVVRSTNADSGTAATASTTAVTWQDMTAILTDPTKPWGVQSGIHPDLHAIVFATGGNTAFIGSDGGVVRLDVSSTSNQSSSCTPRTWEYGGAGTTPTSLTAHDLTECQMLLSGVPTSITPINDGLDDLQFQSMSVDPSAPTSDFLGGTQDNGTWSFTGAPAGTEVVGGDGGQSGFDVGNTQIRFHNYYGPSVEVNFHGGDPNDWLDTYDVLNSSGENASFYTPFITDPVTGGRAYTGLQHVWRTDDDGGSETALQPCNALNYTATSPCGDWQPLGSDLTGSGFGTDRSGDYVVAIARAPGNTGTLWAATRPGRVFVSTNADASPASVTFDRIDQSWTPDRFISGIAVDPTNPYHAWVSYSGYNAYTPDTPGHVFEVNYDPSTHTATWTDRSYDIGDQPITGIAENEQTGDVFASTDFGVLRLASGSSTWTNPASGMPPVAVYGLTYSQSAHRLYAATHGRGAFSLQLASRPTGTLSGPSTLTVGTPATYSATGSSWDGSAVTFSWTLPGTPAAASGSSATFTPTTAGTQVVTVVLTDGGGLTTTLTKSVTVAAAPSTGPTTTTTTTTTTTSTTLPNGPAPAVKLSSIRAVRAGRLTVINAVVTDPTGISEVTVYFGDGKHATVKLGPGGTLHVTHRYRVGHLRKPRKFTIAIVAVSLGARATTMFEQASVKPAVHKK